MLAPNIENESDDEPNTLNQVIRRFDWPKQKETMQAENNFLIKNKPWELIPTPENQQITIGGWCLKFKKNRNCHILRRETR